MTHVTSPNVRTIVTDTFIVDPTKTMVVSVGVIGSPYARVWESHTTLVPIMAGIYTTKKDVYVRIMLRIEYLIRFIL